MVLERSWHVVLYVSRCLGLANALGIGSGRCFVLESVPGTGGCPGHRVGTLFVVMAFWQMAVGDCRFHSLDF